MKIKIWLLSFVLSILFINSCTDRLNIKEDKFPVCYSVHGNEKPYTYEEVDCDDKPFLNNEHLFPVLKIAGSKIKDYASFSAYRQTGDAAIWEDSEGNEYCYCSYGTASYEGSYRGPKCSFFVVRGEVTQELKENFVQLGDCFPEHQCDNKYVCDTYSSCDFYKEIEVFKAKCQ